jgi:hypothetical protein
LLEDSRRGDGSARLRELAHALAQRLLSRTTAAIGAERSGDLRQPTRSSAARTVAALNLLDELTLACRPLDFFSDDLAQDVRQVGDQALELGVLFAQQT